MQLPDMIMSQEQLNKMMEEGLKKGEQGKPKDKDEGKNAGEKGKEGKSGKDGDKQGEGNEGKKSVEGEGLNDAMNGLLYQIYQQQQELRNALEEKLAKEGNKGNGNALTRKVEEIEMDLLNKGFIKQTLQKMLDLKHQLMKLENATFQQGEDTKRESKTNLNSFNNNSNNQIPTAKQYFNVTEILNKQTLPLQPVYKVKVKEYFKNEDD